MGVVFSPTTTTLSKGSTYTFQCQIVPNGWGTSGKMGLTFYDSNGSIVTGYAWATDTIDFFSTTQTITLQDITIPQSASTATMYGQYNDENSNFVYDDIKYSFPAPTVAPSNFVAVQDGKHINFTWTAGSGEGTMTYCVHVGGEDSVPGCTTTTSTSSVCTDCSSYYGTTVDFTLDYYLNGSIKGYLSYRLSVITPSVSATITITQASKSKQVTVSWNGSCSGFTATSKNFKISCSGSSGNLYDGSGSSSVSYTPPTYGTSYRYTNIFTASNTYGDSFSATVYKDFTATAPYYTVGVCINGDWTPCVAYVYRDGWKECHPYVYRDGWKLCDYS